MSDGKAIYDLVKSGLKVANRSEHELRELLRHLAGKGKTRGTAGRIWGEAVAELVIRFIAPKPETAARKGTAALTDFVELTTDPDAPDA